MGARTRRLARRADARLTRTDGPPRDEWSDLGLELLTTQPQRYLDDDAWLQEFGTPVLMEIAQRKLQGFTPGR